MARCRSGLTLADLGEKMGGVSCEGAGQYNPTVGVFMKSERMFPPVSNASLDHTAVGGICPLSLYDRCRSDYFPCRAHVV